MKGKYRRLEREPHEHEPKNQHLLMQRNRDHKEVEQIERVQLVHVMEGGIVMVIDVQKRDAHQHEHAAEQRIEHIFQCGIMPFRTAATELDQKVAGNQHEFPKHEKENQVQRDEDPHGRGFQSQQ